MPNRRQYDREMQALLEGLPQGSRPRLLLHACCAPCSSATLERLVPYFEITVLYYNPNIWPPQEYRRRAGELERFLAETGYNGAPAQHAPAVPSPAPVQLVEEPYRPEAFYAMARGLEEEPEHGARCTACYALRLEEAARYAAFHGFAWFASTLSLSPVKDPVRINALGEALGQKYGVRHLPSEFRKKNGYKRSLELSEEYGLYRQEWCGCEFSAKRLGEERWQELAKSAQKG